MEKVSAVFVLGVVLFLCEFGHLTEACASKREVKRDKEVLGDGNTWPFGLCTKDSECKAKDCKADFYGIAGALGLLKPKCVPCKFLGKGLCFCTFNEKQCTDSQLFEKKKAQLKKFAKKMKNEHKE